MSVLRRLDDDLKTSLKSSDTLRVSALRLLKAAIKNREIEKRQELSDEEILSVLSSMAKQRRESIEQFSMGGRDDLADRERRELSILEEYMPSRLSDDDTEAAIVQAIRESSARGEADLGKVMKILMPRLKGVADGKRVNSRVRELLQVQRP